MDLFADGHPSGKSGEENRGSPTCASGGMAVDSVGPPVCLEELSDEEDAEDEEVAASARNMGLKLSAVRGATGTDTTDDAEQMGEGETPPHAVVASQASGPSSLVMAPQRVPADDILRRHTKHVFILTSAGKPVFTRHGNEEEFSELFGIFRVLMAMAQQRHGDAAAVRQRQRENLQCITAGDLYFYFCVHGELFYVLVTRESESMRSCMRQLRQVHLQLLSLLPTVSSILSRCPSYDLRRLISSTDVGVLRKLVRRNSQEECYLFRCLAAAPLSVRWRRSLESLLVRYHGTAFPATDPTDGGDKNSVANTGRGETAKEAAAKDHLYSFLFFRGRVVCAVGPADSDAPLHVDDALLLMNFTRCLANSQAGEIWAPICLPMYNNTGYLWCYCANMNVMAREARRGRAGSTSFDYAAKLARGQRDMQQRLTGDHDGEGKACNSPCAGCNANTNAAALDTLVDETPATFTKSGGLLLVHIAASQEAFPALAEQTYQVARHLITEIAQLEEELSRHESIPLSLVMSEEKIKDQARQQLLMSCETAPPLAAHSNRANVTSNIYQPVFIHPDGLQWFAAVLRGKPHRGGISTIVYSEPSAAMRYSAHERKRLLRLVVEQRERLGQCSRLSEPLLLMRMNDVNLLLMRTTPTLVASLTEQFCTARTGNLSPFSAATGGGGDEFVSSQEALFASSRVKELMLLFSPQVLNPQMLRCALRVLVRLVAREGELSFCQCPLSEEDSFFMLAKKKAERRHAIAATASAQRKRELKQVCTDGTSGDGSGKAKAGGARKRHRTSDEGSHTVDPLVLSAENPADVLRTIGDHVNTRLQELEFDDDLDADLFDEQQRQLREEAAIAAGTKSRVLSVGISGFLRQQEEQQQSVKMVRIGHNSNAVTAVCGLGSELVVLGDKSGSVYVAELRGGPSPPLSSNSSQKTLLSPCLPAAVLSIAVSDTRGLRPSQRALFERSTVDTSVTSYIAAGGADGTVSIWVTSTRKHMGFLSMHRSAVTGLTFRHDTLYSCSSDETLRVWSVPQMICNDKLFGHQGRVLGIHCLRRERCATVGEDGTMRFWKMDAATQQEFTTISHFGVKVVLECVTMINDNFVLCGASNGALLLFDVNKRKPLAVQEAAHGYGFVGDGTGLEKVVVAAQLEKASGDGEGQRDRRRQNANPITAVASIPYSDVAASASYDGNVRLWRVVTPETGKKGGATVGPAETVAVTATTLGCLASIPVSAIVTSLYFTPSGDALLVGCSKEPRLGRWVVQRRALNAAYVVPLDDARLRAFAACADVEHIPAMLYGFDDEGDEDHGEKEDEENDLPESVDLMDRNGAYQANEDSDRDSDVGNGLFTLGEDGQMQFSAPLEADVTDDTAAVKQKKGTKAKRESNVSSRGAGANNDKKQRLMKKTRVIKATGKRQTHQPAGELPQPQKRKKKANTKTARE